MKIQVNHKGHRRMHIKSCLKSFRAHGGFLCVLVVRLSLCSGLRPLLLAVVNFGNMDKGNRKVH